MFELPTPHPLRQSFGGSGLALKSKSCYPRLVERRDVDVVTMKSIVGSARGIFAALLACALFLAPLAAQAKMAGHAAAHEHAHALTGQSVGATAADAHEHGDHHHAGVADHGLNSPSQHNDHRDHHDGACCGTYCHSGCIVLDVVDFWMDVPVQAFAVFTRINTQAIVPDQLQRPPASLASL